MKHFILTEKEHEALQTIRNHMIANDDIECDITEIWGGHNNEDAAKRRTVLRLIAKGALKLTQPGYNNWVVPFEQNESAATPATTEDATQADKDEVEIRALLDDGKIIDAIKKYRVLYGVDLIEAKTAIDTMKLGKPSPIKRQLEQQAAEIEHLQAERLQLLGSIVLLEGERDDANQRVDDLTDAVNTALHALGVDPSDWSEGLIGIKAAIAGNLQIVVQGDYKTRDDWGDVPAGTITDALFTLVELWQQAEAEKDAAKKALEPFFRFVWSVTGDGKSGRITDYAGYKIDDVLTEVARVLCDIE